MLILEEAGRFVPRPILLFCTSIVDALTLAVSGFFGLRPGFFLIF
jgi:hypothetical protein